MQQDSQQLEDIKVRALSLSALAFVHIRSLSRLSTGEVPSAARLKVIETLADSAHNLPNLVATFGETEWACESTLLSECRLCEDAVREAVSLNKRVRTQS